MPPPAAPFDNELRRVQRLVSKQRLRLMKLTMDAAAGFHHTEVEAARTHLEALEELAAALKARTHSKFPPAPGFNREKYSVLVVDDHDATRYSISRGLRASGYQAIEASAGVQGLELSPYVAALVLDVQLPDLHGFEVCRLVRNEARTRNMPIVHVSAVHHSYADRAASRTAGADDFLTCPVDSTLLAQRIGALLCERAVHA